MTGDLNDKVIFDIIDHVGRWSGRYPESLIKIGHDLADKKFVPGLGLGLGVGGWGWGVGFSLSLRNGLSRSIQK